MSRTIEGIVACHKAADARRRAGQPVWDRTINIKDILHRDRTNESDEHAIAVGKEIAALIRSRVPAEWLDFDHVDCEYDLIEIVEALEDLRLTDDQPAVEDLNGRLNELYDWADAKRVWLGM
ncbi:MAG: hypothetical protein F8N15_00385 [Methanobacterium sp.]|nr:hypothetical protein [Methanobacterium sp.]